MLKIGICEDDKTTREQLHDLIGKILFQYTDMEIVHFSDGDEVIQSIKDGKFQLDLLFLDIHMERLDGMRTADFIRKHSIDVDIIFLTVSQEHVFEGYTYKAFAYCLKPLDEKRLSKDLNRYMEEKNKCAECLNFTVKEKEYRIPLNRVIYFESEKRKVIAHTLTEDVSFYAKLDDIENMVGDAKFMRCHQSYMVNRDMIDSIERTVIIAQGISIPMSRKYYENMKADTEEKVSMRITHSLAMNQEKAGAIVFVKGKLVGTIIRIRSDKEINLGRDAGVSDIVLNDSKISRLHCSVIYHGDTGEYTICDYSKNGLFTKQGERLPEKEPVQIKAGEEIWLGSDENIFQLG